MLREFPDISNAATTKLLGGIVHLAHHPRLELPQKEHVRVKEEAVAKEPLLLLPGVLIGAMVLTTVVVKAWLNLLD